MDEIRETKEITLTYSKAVVKHFSFVKAKEMRGLAKAEDAVKFLIETLVVSINGDSKDIFEKIMDMRVEDYKEIDKALSSLIEGLVEKKV